jgi:hypothetical protein
VLDDTQLIVVTYHFHYLGRVGALRHFVISFYLKLLKDVVASFLGKVVVAQVKGQEVGVWVLDYCVQKGSHFIAEVHPREIQVLEIAVNGEIRLEIQIEFLILVQNLFLFLCSA